MRKTFLFLVIVAASLGLLGLMPSPAEAARPVRYAHPAYYRPAAHYRPAAYRPAYYRPANPR